MPLVGMLQLPDIWLIGLLTIPFPIFHSDVELRKLIFNPLDSILSGFKCAAVYRSIISIVHDYLDLGIYCALARGIAIALKPGIYMSWSQTSS